VLDVDAEAEFEPVALGLAPNDREPDGEALTVDERLLELLGVCAGVGVPLTVASAVGVCEALLVDEVESVPEFDPVELGLAPRESDAVGEALTVDDKLRELLGVGGGVLVPLVVGLAVGVCEKLGELDAESEPEFDADELGLAPRERVPVRDDDNVEDKLGELVCVSDGVPVLDIEACSDGVEDNDRERLVVEVELSVPESDPVELGLAPNDREPDGEALTVDERLLELLGVCAGVGVPLTVASAVGVCEALLVDEVESVPEFDPVELGLAPRESDAVGEALTVEDTLRELLGVGDGVPVLLDVALAVGVCE